MGVVYCSHLDLGNRFRLRYNQVATATLLLVQASVVLTGELEKDGGFSLDWKTQQDCKTWNLKCTAHRFMRCPWDVPKNYYVHQLPTPRKGSSKWYPSGMACCHHPPPIGVYPSGSACSGRQSPWPVMRTRISAEWIVAIVATSKADMTGGRELPKKNIHLLVFLDSSRPVQQQLGGWKRTKHELWDGQLC